MNKLSIHEKQENLFTEMGAFFAFSNKQLAEQKKEGVTYVNMFAGLIAPQENVQKIIDGMSKINKEHIAQDVEKNGINAIIRRELFNFECFFSGDITDCVEALKDYPTDEDSIFEQYEKILNDETHLFH